MSVASGRTHEPLAEPRRGEGFVQSDSGGNTLRVSQTVRPRQHFDTEKINLNITNMYNVITKEKN